MTAQPGETLAARSLRRIAGSTVSMFQTPGGHTSSARVKPTREIALRDGMKSMWSERGSFPTPIRDVREQQQSYVRPSNFTLLPSFEPRLTELQPAIGRAKTKAGRTLVPNINLTRPHENDRSRLCGLQPTAPDPSHHPRAGECDVPNSDPVRHSCVIGCRKNFWRFTAGEMTLYGFFKASVV